MQTRGVNYINYFNRNNHVLGFIQYDKPSDLIDQNYEFTDKNVPYKKILSENVEVGYEAVFRNDRCAIPTGSSYLS